MQIKEVPSDATDRKASIALAVPIKRKRPLYLIAAYLVSLTTLYN
jgi:hypothetical protein